MRTPRPCSSRRIVSPLRLGTVLSYCEPISFGFWGNVGNFEISAYSRHNFEHTTFCCTYVRKRGERQGAAQGKPWQQLRSLRLTRQSGMMPALRRKRSEQSPHSVPTLSESRLKVSRNSRQLLRVMPFPGCSPRAPEAARRFIVGFKYPVALEWWCFARGCIA